LHQGLQLGGQLQAACPSVPGGQPQARKRQPLNVVAFRAATAVLRMTLIWGHLIKGLDGPSWKRRKCGTARDGHWSAVQIFAR